MKWELFCKVKYHCYRVKTMTVAIHTAVHVNS